jgi:hypothetical protein
MPGRKLEINELSVMSSSNGRHKVSVHRNILSGCKAFVVNFFDDKIEVCRGGIDDRRSVSVFFDGGVNPCVTVGSHNDIANGRYLIDQDESNEDVVVAYFEDIIDS